MLFAAGTWDGEWHPEFGPKPGDVIIKEHWAQSGFANTDLDQQLKQRGVRRVILVGLIANTCVDSTERYATELRYHVTLVKDATAPFGKDGMHAAHVVNALTWPWPLAGKNEQCPPARRRPSISSTHVSIQRAMTRSSPSFFVQQPSFV